MARYPFHSPTPATSTRRDFLKGTAALSLLAAAPRIVTAADAPLSWPARNRQAAADLGLPGFVAGVVRNGKLEFVQAEGFADLEKQIPMRRDHIFPVASVSKTFAAVMMMQYVAEKKISLDDYVLDYPFVTVGLTPNRLRDPNTRLKHILSHTSQGTPGDTYLYNGGRYNFIYGVFEKMSGNSRHYEAIAQEFKQRIGDPLGLTSTLPGYPTDKADPRFARIVSTYLLDKSHPTPALDQGAAGATTLYAGSGLLTTLDDLARYAIALDENTLLSRESYATMTAPFVLNDGRQSPYGLGWSTQVIGGQPVHRAYGYGDSYGALLIRLPQKKETFIFLCNSGAASSPFFLGYGNLLTSPFAVNFLREALPGTMQEADDLYAQAFLQHHVITLAGSGNPLPRQLLKRLSAAQPERFRQSDRSLIYLISRLADAALDPEMEQLVTAYDASGDFHPDIEFAIATHYQRIGVEDRYLARLRRLADRPGYGEERPTRAACADLGAALLAQGRTEGRKYIWMAAEYAQAIGWPPSDLDKLIARMRR